MILSVLVVLCFASMTGDVIAFARSIKSSQHRVIAVIPELLEESDEGGLRFALHTQQSMEEMERIRKTLENAAAGYYQIVESKTVLKACRSYRAPDLASDEARREILRQLGADALVIGVRKSNDHASSEIRLSCWPPAANQGKPGRRPVELLYKSDHALSDLAFAGHSFELRRWNGDRIEHVGFLRDGADEKTLVGLGNHYERFQAGKLRKELPHPFSIGDFPYSVQIVVGEDERKPVRVGEEYYVALDVGEKPKIVLRNGSPRNILVGLYIDGQNTHERIREHPLQTRSSRHWILQPNVSYRIDGWHYRKRKQKSRFVIEHTPDDFVDRNIGAAEGAITMLFYTDGTPGIEIPPAIVAKGVAIAGEEPEPVHLRTLPGNKGLLLAALTIHYRSSDQLRRMMSSD